MRKQRRKMKRIKRRPPGPPSGLSEKAKLFLKVRVIHDDRPPSPE